jgi:glycosyltransferase involved in cell wall biosynthesis
VRILWVKAGKLLPVDTGGKIRSYNILRHLARAHEVSLLTYYGGEKDSSYEADILQEFPGAKTVWAASLGGSALAQSAKYLRSAFDPAPFAVTKFAYPTVRQAVVSLLGEKQFDVAVCDFLSASLNFPDVFSTPTVLFQHNVETALWRRMASAESNPVKRIAYQIEAGKMARYEKRTLERFQHIIAVSDHDRQQMLAMVPRCDISVIATGVDTQKYTVAPSATANPPRIVFTGSMDWEPNIDAVIYFCRDIFPRIRSEFPAAVFQIVGRDPHPRVQQLASQRVQVTGTVPFVGDYLRDATVVIVPLRIGGGTRLKIFEAMAMGKAVVSTSIGAEGLKVESGRDLILADDAASFADAVLRLIKDATLRQAYERAAAGLAVQFDWSNIAISFAQVLQKVSESETSNAPLPHSVP